MKSIRTIDRRNERKSISIEMQFIVTSSCSLSAEEFQSTICRFDRSSFLGKDQGQKLNNDEDK